MKLHKITEKIFHVEFPSQYQLTSTFLRFQEHYESPAFRGKIFKLSEFIEWYKTTKDHGQFSYYEDWAGFNIPSHILTPFYEGKFDPLSDSEQALLDLFRSVEGRYYIIGTYDCEDERVMSHELAHALYYVDEEYRSEVNRVLDLIDASPIERLLGAIGYDSSVFRDETHAYLGDDLSYLEKYGVDTTSYKLVHARLLRLREKKIQKKKEIPEWKRKRILKSLDPISTSEAKSGLYALSKPKYILHINTSEPVYNHELEDDAFEAVYRSLNMISWRINEYIDEIRTMLSTLESSDSIEEFDIRMASIFED